MLVEDLWDSIAEDQAMLLFTPEQKNELDRRLDAYEADQAQGREAGEVIAGFTTERRTAMPITLNHTIVPSFDKVESAKFYSRVFGFEYVGAFSHFIVVRVNDTLCLDFDNETQFEPHHYAFKVSEREFDDIFARLLAEKIPYGSGPGNADDMAINHNHGGRGVYFRDPNRHLLEMLTADYVMPPQ